MIKRDCIRPFKVIGKLAEVQVLGTCFVMDESRADTAWVQVESGKVRFSVLGQLEGVELLAGMEAQAVKGQHVLQIVHRPDSVKKEVLYLRILLFRSTYRAFPLLWGKAGS